jgi:putative mRNA 3-end processing factor
MSFYTAPLVSLTEKGLFCEAGGFYLDPHRGVETAIVTHAHSDHARRGSSSYITAQSGVGVLKERLGQKIAVRSVPYQESFTLGRVRVSLHSAGHILGSAQVRIEHDGEVWVVSGDYKRERDPSCEPFEPVRCDTFITEATFGTPKFVWEKDRDHGKEMAQWWDSTAAEGKNAVIFGYSLGKAQRILAELAPYTTKPILIDDSVAGITECYRAEGKILAPTLELSKVLKQTRQDLKGELIIAPPSILKEKLAPLLGQYTTAFASGWMQSNSQTPGRRYDHGFVMSDHSDWNDLNQTIFETGAKRVFVQHRNGTLIRHLRKKGIDAHSDEFLKPEKFKSLGGQARFLW